jgi:phosphate transport system permease protein
MQMLADFPLGIVTALVVIALGSWAWHSGQVGARKLVLAGSKRLHSLPIYHAWYRALLVVVPALALLLIHGVLAQTSDGFAGPISKVAFGVSALALAGSGYFLGTSQFAADFRARTAVERWVSGFMIAASAIAIITTMGIVLSLLFETIKFFSAYSPIDFLFGTQWSPQVAIRADQVGQSGAFGAVPLFLGTFLIMAIAMVVAVPVGLGSAIYLSEYASGRARSLIKPVLELLAGIPTVVFGFFALLTVAPVIRAIGNAIGLETSAQSALAAGLVMGIMIIPFISSLSDDVINAVPQALRDGSFAMGATKSETIGRVVIPAALPGIVGSVLLAVSKALGETMIVTMAAGQNANLTVNPLDMVTTVTVQIVTLLTGDQEYDSPKTQAAFALGFVLFFVTLILNIIALRVVQKYREKYD